MTTCIVPKSDESEDNTDKEINNSDYATLHINAILIHLHLWPDGVKQL